MGFEPESFIDILNRLQADYERLEPLLFDEKLG